ncbi:MAG TPA: CBS domain-containing protein [Methylomirabilota bacterium]|nr:CBS domain-containing protein [Methylomirabilota bacterium]
MSAAAKTSSTGRRAPEGTAAPATVADIMVKPPVVAAPHTTVAEARALLRQGPMRHLPVLDGELLVGIVSERDLDRAPSEDTPLSAVMTRTVFVLSPHNSIRDAARRFRKRRFGAMPVLDGRRLIGMVSVVDVLRAPAEQPKV